MRVPHVIPRHAFEAYRCSEETRLLPGEQGRSLRSEDEHWDVANLPEDLKRQALRVIAANWRGNPLLDELPSLDDRDYLLEILPLDLPLEMTIVSVPHEHYWERAAEARWKFNDPSAHGGSWLRLYCERHLSEYLEALDPAHFEAETRECEALLELVREHVQALELRQLLPHRCQARAVPAIGEAKDDQEDEQAESVGETVRVLPLDHVLEGLPQLRSVCINVGVVQRNGAPDDWQDFRLSVEDALRLGRGLKNLKHLIKFSLTRSFLDQPRAAAILRGIAVNNSVREVDLSHCKLGNAGGLAVGGFLAHRQPEVLRLVNCAIGSEGLAGIVLGILGGEASSGCVRRLNLRLNPLGDDGAGHVAALLLRFASLEYLNVSGCSFGPEAGMGMAEVLASGRTKFSKLVLDCSNNDLGTIVGEAFEIVAKACVAITGLDVRMCGFRKESEYTISESVNRNRAARARRDKAAAAAAASRGESVKVTAAETTELPQRRSSLAPPPEFAIFQQPHEHRPPVRSSEDDAKPTGGEGSESERLSGEEEAEEPDSSQIGWAAH